MKATVIKYGFVINKKPRVKEQVLRLQAKAPRPRECVYLGHVGPCLPRRQMPPPPRSPSTQPPLRLASASLLSSFATSFSSPSFCTFPSITFSIFFFCLSPPRLHLDLQNPSAAEAPNRRLRIRSSPLQQIRYGRRLISPAGDRSLPASRVGWRRASRCVLAM